MESPGVGLQGQGSIPAYSPGVGLQGAIPAYSPAYKQTTGPQYTRQAPGTNSIFYSV